VVILPHNDDAGRALVRRVYRELCRQVPPAEVRVVELPGLSLHGGLFEFGLLRGGSTPELGEAIEEMAEQTAEFEGVRRLPAPRRVPKALPALRTAQLADLRAGPVQWLWPGRIPMGKLSLLFGGPGRGKSFIAAYLAAAVSTGAAWPDDQGAAPHGSVLLLCGQDALADTVRPRLELAGADLVRVTAVDVGGPAGGGAGRFSPARALERPPPGVRRGACRQRALRVHRPIPLAAGQREAGCRGSGRAGPGRHRLKPGLFTTETLSTQRRQYRQRS
jgi:hypothetical protein